MRRARLSRNTASRTVTLLVLALTGSACGREGAPTVDPLGDLFGRRDGRFVQVSSFDTSGGNVDRLEIAVGDSAVILDHPGPGIIRRAWFTVFSRDPHYLRRIALKMYWDGEKQASVLAPLGDFFGAGFEKRHYAALPMGVTSGGFYSYLPLPFSERARIVIENGTDRNIDAFYYNIDILEVDRLPDDVATFHASWRRDRRTTRAEPHLALSARGRGWFVGLQLHAESHAGRLWFLEGDEIFHIDGEPRGQGTGTEDYFNAGWYFESGEFAAPYHGLILKDEERARIVAYRWHLPDPIPFQDSIRVELEHGHANESVADYATMAYWYQVEPHAPLPLLPPADQRRALSVKIPPGAVPAESLAIETRNGRPTFVAAVPRPDRYEVLVFPISVADSADHRYRVAGGAWRRIDRPAAEPGIALPPIALDTVAAESQVAVEFDAGGGQDATACARCPCADLCPAALWPRPLRSWATAWNVVGPFPNPQRLGTEYSPAIDSVYGPERDSDLDADYATVSGHRSPWKIVEADGDGRVRLNAHFEPNDWVAAYARAFLYSPNERDAMLLLGADDAHVLWVNGQRVSQRQGRHISLADDIAIPVRLRGGWNSVLLKLADLDGGWAFMLRAADPSGELRWSTRPGG